MPLITEDQEALLNDIRDYLFTPSSTLLQKLQDLNILPLEDNTLDMAIELLSGCTAFFRVYESSHYSNPFLGFDPSAEGALRTMKQLKDLYRKHTTKDFIKNLHQLSHLVTIDLHFRLPGKQPTSKAINLRTDEERLSPEERKALRRLRWTHTIGNSQQTPEHKKPEDKNDPVILHQGN